MRDRTATSAGPLKAAERSRSIKSAFAVMLILVQDPFFSAPSLPAGRSGRGALARGGAGTLEAHSSAPRLTKADEGEERAASVALSTTP